MSIFCTLQVVDKVYEKRSNASKTKAVKEWPFTMSDCWSLGQSDKRGIFRDFLLLEYILLQVGSSKEGSVVELQEWTGHRDPRHQNAVLANTEQPKAKQGTSVAEASDTCVNRSLCW